MADSTTLLMLAECLLAAGRTHITRQAHHVHERAVVELQHVQLLLGEIADIEALAFGDLPGKRVQVAGDGLDHSGLALPVGTENADALARQRGVRRLAGAGGAAFERRLGRDPRDVVGGVGRSELTGPLGAEVSFFGFFDIFSLRCSLPMLLSDGGRGVRPLVRQW